MNTHVKRTVLLCLSAALCALLLLSISLSSLHLQHGALIPGAPEPGSPLREIVPLTTRAHVLLPLPGMIIGSILIALLVYTLARLVGLVDARRILQLILGIVFLIGLANILPRVAAGPPALLAEETPAAAFAPSQQDQTSPLGEAPSLFSWLAAGCLLLGAAGLAVLLRKRPPGMVQAGDGLAQSAEDALREVAAGKDFSSVILECYLRMSDVVRAERNLQRPREITAREFQDALEQHGLPPGPVRDLTLLFERARYGGEPMSPFDVDAGRECLRQVVYHCRGADREDA